MRVCVAVILVCGGDYEFTFGVCFARIVFCFGCDLGIDVLVMFVFAIVV